MKVSGWGCPNCGRKHKRANERQVSIGKHQVAMPARPYLGISQEDDQELREIILNGSFDEDDFVVLSERD